MNKGHSIFVVAALVGSLQAFTAAAQQSATDTATATTTAPAAAMPSAAQPAPAVDEKKLDQFATAYVKIQTLQKDAANQPPSSDPAAARQKQSELQSRMTEAVEQSGLNIAEFNTIAQAMISDTDLRTRIQIKVQEHTRQGG